MGFLYLIVLYFFPFEKIPCFNKQKKKNSLALNMPREVQNLKEFLKICARKDARYLKIKKPTKPGTPSALTTANNKKAKAAPTKFKVRCSRFLYTYTVADKKRAERI